MHKGIMGKRRLEALNAIIATVKELGGPEIDEQADGLSSITHRDPDVRSLFMLEGVAELLQEISDGQAVDQAALQEALEAGMDRQAVLDQIMADVGDDLTKTSTEALQAWAAAEEE